MTLHICEDNYKFYIQEDHESETWIAEFNSQSEAEKYVEMLEKEKAILISQAEESGKPAEIIEKMIGGRIRKYLAEITLVGQPFVKDPDKTVETLLAEAGATVSSFVRYEVGEGIEKKQENFADEVMAQING